MRPRCPRSSSESRLRPTRRAPTRRIAGFRGSRCTSRSPRTSARRSFSSSASCVLLFARRAPRSTCCCRAASIGLVIVARDRDRRRRSASYYNSDKAALAISHAKPADPQEYARLYNLVEGLCIASGLPKPRLYIIDDPAPNAFSTGRNPKHAAIAVTTGLLEKMNRVELEGVLAHELSHIRNYDILVMTLTVTMVGMIVLLSDFFLRFMFFGGGRGGATTTRTTRSAIVFMVFGFVLLDLRPDHRLRHAVRGEPPARVPRRRVGRAAHPLPAGADLRAREAEGRPHVDPLGVEGDRAPLDRGAARQGRRTRAAPGSTTCSTPTRRSTTASARCRRCERHNFLMHKRRRQRRAGARSRRSRSP